MTLPKVSKEVALPQAGVRNLERNTSAMQGRNWALQWLAATLVDIVLGIASLTGADS